MFKAYELLSQSRKEHLNLVSSREGLALLRVPDWVATPVCMICKADSMY